MSDRTVAVVSQDNSRKFSMYNPSSKKIVIFMPWEHQCCVKGRISLVKINGAEDSPNGNTVNM